MQTSRLSKGFTALDNVSRSGFRTSVREWLPNGRLLPSVDVRLATDRLYVPAKTYRVTDVNVSTGEVAQLETKADAEVLVDRTRRSGGGRKPVEKNAGSNPDH